MHAFHEITLDRFIVCMEVGNMSQNQETPKLTKAESARINGAKSHGATTPEGKLRAANGNLKHGAWSSRVLMEGENYENYQRLLDYFLELFDPMDTFEAECVVTMANTRWRIRRLERAETDALNAAVLLNRDSVQARFEAVDTRTERALAIVSDNINLDRNTRVEERLHRIYERNFKLLSNYRRKSGRSLPQAPATTSDSADSPSNNPDPSRDATPDSTETTANPGNATPLLTDPPKMEPAPAATPAAIISQVAMFLILFASLFLSAANATPPDLLSFPPQPAFYSSTRLPAASEALSTPSGKRK